MNLWVAYYILKNMLFNRYFKNLLLVIILGIVIPI